MSPRRALWTRRQLLRGAVVAGAALTACSSPLAPGAPAPAAAGASAGPDPVVPVAPPSAPPPAAEVRQATLGIIGEAAAFVALERGYFAVEGLAVEIVNARATDQILLGLTGGQIMVFPAPC